MKKLTIDELKLQAEQRCRDEGLESIWIQGDHWYYHVNEGWSRRKGAALELDHIVRSTEAKARKMKNVRKGSLRELIYNDLNTNESIFAQTIGLDHNVIHNIHNHPNIHHKKKTYDLIYNYLISLDDSLEWHERVILAMSDVIVADRCRLEKRE